MTDVLGIIVFDHSISYLCYEHNMFDFGGFGVLDDPCDVDFIVDDLLSFFLKNQQEILKISLHIHSLGACKRLQKQRQEITLNLQITPIVMK